LGKRGKVLRVSGKRNRAVVEGLHIIKRHTRKSQQHPDGGILDRDGSVHISNLMAAEKYDARASARANKTPAPTTTQS
jgi:large subunit ribosomal protein L24